MAKKGKQPQRAPGAHKAPTQEEDNPRVRCWKCGAFGHKASSLRCPMNRRSGALAPHALGSKEMKETRNPWNPRDLWNGGPFNKGDRLTQQRVRNEEHRQDLRQRLQQTSRGGLQHNWKDKTEPCDNMRVRCWNCREFGHKASSHRCPLKHRSRALAPQAMGSNKMKENLKSWNPWLQENPGRINRAARKTEQRAWQEEQRQDPCWRLPWRPTGRTQKHAKEETESCAYVRHRHKPRPDHTKMKYVGDPDSTTWSLKRKRVMTCTALPIKGVERSACLPAGSKNGQEGPVTDAPHTEGTHCVQDPTYNVHEKDNRPHSAFMIQGLDQTLIHQPHAKFPNRNSHSIQHASAHSVGQDSDMIIKMHGKRAAKISRKTCQKSTKKSRLSPCVKSTQSPDLQSLHQGPPIKTLQPCQLSPFPQIPGVPGQPLSKVFMTLDKDQWSIRYMTPPSLPPSEKPSTPAQIPSTTEESEALCPCVALSVLLEALHLSSSSEEGDGQ